MRYKSAGRAPALLLYINFDREILMNKEQTYAALEAQMLAYDDIIDVPVRPNGEPLVPLVSNQNLVAYQLRKEMLPITGEAIYVRSGVAERLGQVACNLAKQD